MIKIKRKEKEFYLLVPTRTSKLSPMYSFDNKLRAGEKLTNEELDSLFNILGIYDYFEQIEANKEQDR